MVDGPVPRGAWRALVLAVAGNTAASMLVSTPTFLIPLLHLREGMPLATAGLYAAAPTFGLVLTLVAWGALTDRYGSRRALVIGLPVCAALGLAAAAAAAGGFGIGAAQLLIAAGAASASANSASGPLVVSWFPRSRRGFAMGIRQVALPLGVAAAALTVPPIADAFGAGAALAVVSGVVALTAIACAVGVRDPGGRAAGTPRAPTAPSVNPYRAGMFLPRIHLVSILLVLPQFTLSTFGLVWLIVDLRWSAGAAGIVVAAAQLVGAFGRIAIGAFSDRLGSRVRLLRIVACAGVVALVALALSDELHLAVLAATVLVVASTVSVADNGLAFTSVAEAAGAGWSGRALGVQNTGQYLAASAVGPGVGAVIALLGFPAAFALVAIAPLVAVPLVPARDQHA